MKAGYIASRVREKTRSYIEVGRPVIEICDFVEDNIKKLGGAPAFPCNVDIDRVAAHYTSPLGDPTVITDGTLVKVDIGVHIEGYIADTAVTICLEPRHTAMVEAAEAGLEAAIKMVRAGVAASDIGAAIERAIKSRGFTPIRNLTGHRMSRYIVHAGQSIPNIGGTNGPRLAQGEVYAIEPFAVPRDAAAQVIDPSAVSSPSLPLKTKVSNIGDSPPKKTVDISMSLGSLVKATWRLFSAHHLSPSSRLLALTTFRPLSL